MINNLSIKLLKKSPGQYFRRSSYGKGNRCGIVFIIHYELCCLKCKNDEVMIDIGYGFKPYVSS